MYIRMHVCGLLEGIKRFSLESCRWRLVRSAHAIQLIPRSATTALGALISPIPWRHLLASFNLYRHVEVGAIEEISNSAVSLVHFTRADIQDTKLLVYVDKAPDLHYHARYKYKYLKALYIYIRPSEDIHIHLISMLSRRCLRESVDAYCHHPQVHLDPPRQDL